MRDGDGWREERREEERGEGFHPSTEEGEFAQLRSEEVEKAQRRGERGEERKEEISPLVPETAEEGGLRSAVKLALCT